MDSKEKRQLIISAGWEAVDHLIKVAKEEILTGKKDEDLSADRLKNAAATKKLALFDAFEIVKRLELEQHLIDGTQEPEGESKKKKTKIGIAERLANEKG